MMMNTLRCFSWIAIPFIIQSLHIHYPTIRIFKLYSHFSKGKLEYDINSSIEVYSRVGCKYCVIAKRKLDELSIQYTNIDINEDVTSQLKLLLTASDINDSLFDVYRSRVLDRISFTKARSVPQIFVGKEHIGGCDNMLDSINSLEFFSKLDQNNISYSTQSRVIEYQSNSIQDSDTSDLFTIGKPLNNPINQSVLEYDITENALALSSRLQSDCLRMIDQYTLNDGKLVDYTSLRRSSEFKSYLQSAYKLTLIPLNDLISLPDSMKLGFFINLYNALIIHATVCFGSSENNPSSRSDFYSGKTGGIYNISGLLFSPDDIEHGIIRANYPHPSTNKSSFFDYEDTRTKLSVLKLDPRIHFILNCGAKSCPPIRVINQNQDINEALQLAASSYLIDEVSFNCQTGQLFMPRLTLWYAKDFGDSLLDQVTKVLSWLPESILAKLYHDIIKYSDSLEPVTISSSDPSTLPVAELLSRIYSQNIQTNKRVNIEYNLYDWTSNAANT